MKLKDWLLLGGVALGVYLLSRVGGANTSNCIGVQGATAESVNNTLAMLRAAGLDAELQCSGDANIPIQLIIKHPTGNTVVNYQDWQTLGYDITQGTVGK